MAEFIYYITLCWTCEKKQTIETISEIGCLSKIAFKEFNFVKNFDDLVPEDIIVEEGVEMVLGN